jgi:DNA polymerase-3 subunit delta'
MPFSQLIGNEPAKKALTKMVEERTTPNTLLFSGPSGVGKSRFALSLAALLMGLEHASRVFSESHPDLHIFHTEGKGKLHSIESMRHLIHEVGMPPFEAPVKVFILHDAHQMLPASSNALLKTLEEPSSDTYILLLTHQPEILLPTIVSRCRKIPFFPIPDPEIVDYVIKQLGKSAEEASKIAFLAQGSLAKAFRLATQPQDERRLLLYQILQCGPADYPHFLKVCTQLETICQVTEGSEADESKDSQDIDGLFEEIVAWYRDLHLLAQGMEPSLLHHLEAEAMLRDRARAQLPSLEHVFESIERCRLGLQRSMKLRVVLEELFFQLA